jgi:hypothetical protein
MENHAAATALNYFRLQFHQDSPYSSHVPGYGHWRYRSPVERRRFGRSLGSLRTAEGGKSGISETCISRSHGSYRSDTFRCLGWHWYCPLKNAHLLVISVHDNRGFVFKRSGLRLCSCCRSCHKRNSVKVAHYPHSGCGCGGPVPYRVYRRRKTAR